MLQHLLLACLAGPLVQEPAAPAATAPVEISTGLAGSWEGAIDIPGQELRFELDFEQDATGGWSGDISIPDQGAVDLPLEEIHVEGDQATFRIQGIPGEPTFEGTVADRTLSGTFQQGAGSFPFECRRPADTAHAGEGFAALLPRIEQALTDHNVPSLGVAVVHRGQVLFAGGFGYSDVENSTPADGDTLYSIGSSTKAFTAFALAQLVDNGELSWNTPVQQVLPGFDLSDPYAADHITLQDLLTHRSGLPRHDLAWYLSPDATRQELLGALQHLEPNARLGERFQYQNFMYMTAGLVVEAATGKTWEASLTETVLGPLGMAATGFQVPADLDEARATGSALPYSSAEGGGFELEDFYPISAMGPAGSIRSSANEMTRWLELLLSEGTSEGTEFLSREAFQSLLTCHSTIPTYPERTDRVTVGYGLGWFLESYKGHYYAQHGGNINGFSAMVGLFPLDELGIVVLANRNGTGLPGLVALTIADQVLELKADDWLASAQGEESEEDENDPDESEADAGIQADSDAPVAASKPVRPLDHYAGRYEHAAYGLVTIALAEDGESLTAGLGEKQWPLAHQHYEVFRPEGDAVPGPLRNLVLHFRADSTGRIEFLEIPFEPAIDPVRFARLPDATLQDPAFLERLVGRYAAGENITLAVTLAGDILHVSQNGSPPMELSPMEGTSFSLVIVKGYTLEFEVPESGLATALIAFEPGDSTRCPRIEDDSSSSGRLP